MIRPSLRVIRHQTYQNTPRRVLPAGARRIQDYNLPSNYHSSSSSPYSTSSTPSRLVLSISNINKSPALPGKNSNGNHRSIHTSPIMASATPKKKGWSAQQYLKFGNERTRPVYDLVSQVVPLIPSSISNPRIYDLGCGPGNSTQVLKDALPTAQITGMDSSPDMLRKARSALPDVDFQRGDLASYSPEEGAHLLFSNAVFHWLRQGTRIPTIVRLFETMESGGVLAFQVPDNYNQPSHILMRETATQPNTPWEKYFSGAGVGDLSVESRPDLDPIEAPSVFYNALVKLAAPGSVNVWRTEYQHALQDARGIVEWVKGTGLQPYLHRIEDGVARQAFYQEYEKRLKEAYPVLEDGKVLLAYPRLFVVAVRG